jgi:hypothetical protein
MSNSAADESSPGHRLHLGIVDRVRVRVGYGRTVNGPASDVFLLDLPGVDAGGAFDEAPYLESLEPILDAGTGVSPTYTVHVNRSRASWSAGESDVEIRVHLATGSKSPLAQAAVDAVADAFKRALEYAGTPEAVTLHHDEAIEHARARVVEAYPELHSVVLTVSEEEHRAAEGAWRVGFRGRDLDRYVVMLGFVEGYSGSARVQHVPQIEVIDSVGSESF